MQPATTTRFTVKASLGSEIRRFNLEKCEFAALKDACMSIFNMPAGSAPAFKYTDDESDVVTISSTAELVEAFRVYPEVLRIAVDVVPFSVPRKPAFKPAAAPAPAPSVVVGAAPAAPTAAASSAAAAPAVASPAPAVAPIASAAVPAPAPIHNNNAPASPSAVSADDELKAARADLIDIRSRFQAASDKSLKAQLRPQLMAAKGRVLALHVAAKSHKVAAQMERKQVRVAVKKVEKQEKHAEKQAEKKAEKQEKHAAKEEKHAEKEEKKAEKHQEKKGLKEQMLLGRFVRDVTIPDGFEMDGGRAFVKTWRFRNDSTRAWAAGTRLLFVGKNSDRMGALDSLPITAVLQPGEECDVSASLTSPAEPGRYTAYFRLADAAGRKFGQRVWVQIQVTADSSSESENSAKDAAAVPAVAPAAAAVPKKQKEKPAFEPSAEELAKYGVHLRTLGSMGFLNTKRNLRLLNRFAGNLDRTVEILLRKPEKNKPQATA